MIETPKKFRGDYYGTKENERNRKKGRSVMTETVEDQHKRLSNESVLPMAIDDGREVVVSCAGCMPKTKPSCNIDILFFDYIDVTYRSAKGEEENIRYYRNGNAR